MIIHNMFKDVRAYNAVKVVVLEAQINDIHLLFYISAKKVNIGVIDLR
tara:strand:+ start:200 stop:343 length:144 start_codon:yes stop_codon:yes gene_type:complete